MKDRVKIMNLIIILTHISFKVIIKLILVIAFCVVFKFYSINYRVYPHEKVSTIKYVIFEWK